MEEVREACTREGGEGRREVREQRGRVGKRGGHEKERERERESTLSQ